MNTLNIKLAIILLFIASMVSSCDEFKDSNNYSTEELDKDLSGKWQISKVTRNGLDITKSMDFSTFSITFNNNNTYNIDNYLPFLVREDGTWDIDDPKYPSQLKFREEGAPDANISSFDYIIDNGQRNIVLSFSPGCHSNIYTYVLERTSN